MTKLSFFMISPDRTQSFAEVTAISCPTPEGQLQILPGHADLVTETSPGACIIEDAAGEKTLQIGTPGMLKVSDNKAILII